jgi:lipopolysaccharide export system permease protein
LFLAKIVLILRKNYTHEVVGIKNIDKYVLKNFLVLLVVLFFIVLFIVVMQFTWLNIDALVGKGVPLSVLGKFFFYASVTSTPIALPLAILLTSLMTFGNLGERLELLAMKTAGIPLFRIMGSLIVFISLIVVGAFFFSNNVIPIAQTRMWALMFSFKNKSPELEMPVGEFYSGIKGWNIYVRDRDTSKKALLDVMLYDFSKGFENASVTSADTVRISTTADKQYLIISMINGEVFENMPKQNENRNNIPYRRESFSKKEVLIEFDRSFKEMDEKVFANQYVSKNFIRLTRDIDSINIVRDSLKNTYAQNMIKKNIFSINNTPNTVENHQNKPISKDYIDSLFLSSTQNEMSQIVNAASIRIQSVVAEVSYNSTYINDADYFFIRHSMEWHRKFTLSFACLIFFFIGAPLGAIINKGGLGVPAVVSIAFFVVYYVVNTTGIKMASENIWTVWQGMWLSSGLLLPIGIFLTYKSATDSILFNSETYQKFIDKIKVIFKRRAS